MAEVKKKKCLKFQTCLAAKRWTGIAGVVIIFLIVTFSYILPKNRFQLTKEELVSNPNNFEAHLILAEEFLKNNQFQEGESFLLLAQANLLETSRVLGKKTSFTLENLWKNKHYSDKKDVYRLITFWQKIVTEKPNYRDGYLQLAFLFYQIYEDDNAKNYLQKALEIDPNYEPTKELEKLLVE